MLVKRAIERCIRLRFQARLVDVPKPKGDRRVFLDLSYLNNYVKFVIKFMEHLGPRVNRGCSHRECFNG